MGSPPLPSTSMPGIASPLWKRLPSCPSAGQRQTTPPCERVPPGDGATAAGGGGGGCVAGDCVGAPATGTTVLVGTAGVAGPPEAGLGADAAGAGLPVSAVAGTSSNIGSAGGGVAAVVGAGLGLFAGTTTGAAATAAGLAALPPAGDRRSTCPGQIV